MNEYFNMTIGSDIKLNIKGDISAGNSGDVEIVANDSNLLQSARTSVMTAKGTDQYNPEFGSDLNLFTSLPNSASMRTLAGSVVADALLSNPKIKKVDNVKIKKESDTSYSIECGIVPIAQDRVYNLVFPVKA